MDRGSDDASQRETIAAELDLRARWESIRAAGRVDHERAAMREAVRGRQPVLRAVVEGG